MERPVFLPGGVADPLGRAGYVADPSGGILALNLGSGQPLWRSEAASRPLLVHGDRLAAERLADEPDNALRVVLLDITRQGEPVFVSDPVVLPEWVALPASREAFSRAVRYERGELLLDWEAHARYGGGAPPSLEIQRAATRDASGTAAVDLESGRVSALPQDEGAQRTRAERVAGLEAHPDGIGPAGSAEPWVVGGRLALVVPELAGREQSLQLRTWDRATGQPGPTRELARGERLVTWVTPDGRYVFVFVHQDLPAAAPAPWWVFSAETGERLATLSRAAGAHSPCVLGDRVYYLVEGPPAPIGQARVCSLEARELATDRPLWELPLPGRRPSPAPPLRP